MPIPLEEGIDPFDCDWKSALRNLGLQVTNESLGNGTAKDVVKGRCIKPFPGRIVYRSITGKFDDHNMCTEGYKHVFDVGEVRCPLLVFESEDDEMLLLFILSRVSLCFYSPLQLHLFAVSVLKGTIVA